MLSACQPLLLGHTGSACPGVQAFVLVQGRKEGGRSSALQTDVCGMQENVVPDHFQLNVVNFLCNSSNGRAGVRKGKEREKQIVPIFCIRPLAEATFFTPQRSNFLGVSVFHPVLK